MLHQLPAEIALHSISYLPLHSLCFVTRVSRDWNALITINEATVYRNAAVLHYFIGVDEPACSVPMGNWRAFCKRQLEIEKGWRGKAPSVVRELTAAGSSVHRFKIDPELGFIITTCRIGGLSVCDIKNNRVLWSLPSTHAVHFAHCEYDRGYIVFNRHDNCKEVWRRSIDEPDVPPPEASPPDQSMLQVSSLIPYSTENCRAHFRPWALLRVPENSRAFRFSYPTLLAAAKHNAYLWDVPSSQLILVVRDIQQTHHGASLGHINYVEVNDLYVFICGSEGLRIFTREGGGLLYQVSSMELSSATREVLPQTPGLASSVLHPQMLLHNSHPLSSYHGEFTACHVSTSGSDLAILTTHGRLVIIPGFQRLFSGSNTVHHRDITTVLDFQPYQNNGEISCYLAAGNQSGKLAIATRKGIYVISPDFNFSRLTTERLSQPDISVCRLSNFDNVRLLSFVSCLQITQDAIYFTYKPSHANGELNAAPVQVAGVHGPPEVEVFPPLIGEMEDGFEDGWEDEDEEMQDFGDDLVPVLLDELFLPTNTNTVYRVGF